MYYTREIKKERKRLKGDFRALQSEGMVYFLSPRAICTDVLLRATACIRCNQFLLRKNERIACRLPALLPVTYANYVSTETRVCYNTAYARLLLLYDSVSILYSVYPYVMCTSHFFSVYSAYSCVIYTVFCLFAITQKFLHRIFKRLFADVRVYRYSVSISFPLTIRQTTCF